MSTGDFYPRQLELLLMGVFSLQDLLVNGDTEATSEVIYPIPRSVLKEKKWNELDAEDAYLLLLTIEET